MTNFVYPLWKQALMDDAQVNKGLTFDDATNGTYVALITIGGAGYVYSAAHQFYTDLNHIQGIDQRITLPVVNASGIFSGQTVVYTAITGTEVGAIVLYRHNSGANSTWRLILYEDTGVIGFPITPNGGNLIVTWNVGGIFQL